MIRNQSRQQRYNAFLLRLTEGADLLATLQEFGYSPGRALQILRGGRGATRIRKLRALSKIQKDLILRKNAPGAARALSRQLDSEANPKFQLRSALAILKLAAKNRRAAKPRKHSSQAQTLPPPTTPQIERAIDAVADYLAEERRRDFST